jgi:hypothetical protein
MPTPSSCDARERASRSNRRAVVEQHRRQQRVVEHGAAIEQQSQAIGKCRRPHVHLGEPGDRRLAADGRARIEAIGENRADVVDRMRLERPDEIVARGHHGWRFQRSRAFIEPRPLVELPK